MDLEERVYRIEKILETILEDEHIYKSVGFNRAQELRKLKEEIKDTLYKED